MEAKETSLKNEPNIEARREQDKQAEILMEAKEVERDAKVKAEEEILKL